MSLGNHLLIFMLGNWDAMCYSFIHPSTHPYMQQAFFEYLLCERHMLGTEEDFSSVQFLSCIWAFVTPWTAVRQASLSITNSWSLLKVMFVESVMPFNHLILCCPLLLLPSILPSIRVFGNESVLRIRWPKYWSLFHHQSFQLIFRTDFF